MLTFYQKLNIEFGERFNKNNNFDIKYLYDNSFQITFNRLIRFDNDHNIGIYYYMLKYYVPKKSNLKNG
jgi:hypothetical protein